MPDSAADSSERTLRTAAGCMHLPWAVLRRRKARVSMHHIHYQSLRESHWHVQCGANFVLRSGTVRPLTDTHRKRHQRGLVRRSPKCIQSKKRHGVCRLTQLEARGGRNARHPSKFNSSHIVPSLRLPGSSAEVRKSLPVNAAAPIAGGFSAAVINTL